MKKIIKSSTWCSTAVSIVALATLAIASTTATAGNYYSCAPSTGCNKVDRNFTFTKYNATKYPIVMAHGFLGWNRALNVLDYFNGIPQTLGSNGAEVYTTKTSTINSVEFRGEQLLSQVRTIKAITGSDKVNLFGHSQGGLDARYVASVDPQAVASVTTVASPHQGTGFADTLAAGLGDAEGEGADTLRAKLVYTFAEILGLGIGAASGIPLNDPQKQDAEAAIRSLSTESIKAFNIKYPGPIASSYCGNTPANNVTNGVAYYSFSGVGQLTSPVDPSDLILKFTGSFYDKSDLNDGLVTKCSSRIGTVIRDDYRMNHLDSINQFFGLVSLFETNPLAVYRQQTNRLKNAGF